MVVRIEEERFSFCCYAPPLGGIEEYGYCGACEEQTEFLPNFWFEDMDREFMEELKGEQVWKFTEAYKIEA